jgi:hypothetical protein
MPDVEKKNYKNNFFWWEGLKANFLMLHLK